MKTARFSQVVAKCGAPELHLVLIDPAKDRALQAAVKAQRVMTLFQQSVGSRTDHGEVGFQPGPGRQFLVFPHSLRAFGGRTVVGIKYELVQTPDVPKSERAQPAPPPRKKKPAPAPAAPAPAPTVRPAAPAARPHAPTARPSSPTARPHAPAPSPEPPTPRPHPPKRRSSAKVIDFQASTDDDSESPEIAALKKQVRQAMRVLEEGKPVAAFNLLKRIVGE